MVSFPSFSPCAVLPVSLGPPFKLGDCFFSLCTLTLLTHSAQCAQCTVFTPALPFIFFSSLLSFFHLAASQNMLIDKDSAPRTSGSC